MPWSKVDKPKTVVLTFRIDEEEDLYMKRALQLVEESPADFIRGALASRVAQVLGGDRESSSC